MISGAELAFLVICPLLGLGSRKERAVGTTGRGLSIWPWPSPSPLQPQPCLPPLQHPQGPRPQPMGTCFLFWYPAVPACAPPPACPSPPGLAASNAADNSRCRKAITLQMGCASECVCARTHTHTHTGEGQLQQAKHLVYASLAAIIASGDILAPSSTPLPLVPCPGRWPQLAHPGEGAWSSGQGTDVLCPAGASPGLAEGPGVCALPLLLHAWQVDSEWLRHPSHAAQTSGDLGSRAAGAGQRGCWRHFGGIHGPGFFSSSSLQPFQVSGLPPSASSAICRPHL